MNYDLAGAEQDGTEANNIISGARLNEIVDNDHDQYYGQAFSAFFYLAKVIACSIRCFQNLVISMLEFQQ